MRRITTKVLAAAAAGAALLILTTAASCDTTTKSSNGTDIANNRTNYTPKNDVEGHNYNARQQLADNPSTLIWCTAYPASPNAQYDARLADAFRARLVAPPDVPRRAPALTAVAEC